MYKEAVFPINHNSDCYDCLYSLQNALVIRIDFEQSLGRMKREIEEDSGYVEVCLNLTSAGNGVFNLPIIVSLTTLTTDTAFIPG